MHRNLRLFLIPLCLFLFAFSCKDIQQSKSKMEDTTKVVVKSMTEKHYVPGVQSNIRKSIRYESEFSVECLYPIDILNLIVDSVKVPISSFVEGDKNRGRNGRFGKGKTESVVILAPRIIFNDNPNKMVEEIVLEKHDYEVPEGEALLEYVLEEVKYVVPLGPITQLESVYNP